LRNGAKRDGCWWCFAGFCSHGVGGRKSRRQEMGEKPLEEDSLSHIDKKKKRGKRGGGKKRREAMRKGSIRIGTMAAIPVAGN